MIYKCFAVKDKALDSYSAPFTQATVEAGQRMWRDLVMFEGGENNRYARNPEDYSLYLLGEYDDTTGQMIALETPMQISNATDVISDKPTTQLAEVSQ